MKFYKGKKKKKSQIIKKGKDIIINGARPKPIIIHTKKNEKEKENPI